MRLAWVAAGWLAVAGLPLLAQAPKAASKAASTAAPVTKAPGDPVTLEVRANSRPSGAPVALKWEVIFPAQLMEIEAGATEAGPSAKDSGKALRCTARTLYAYSCTVSGGEKPIPDGIVAIFHFRILASAPAGTATLRIEGAVATEPDAKVASLPSTESIVVIQ